MGNKSLTWLLIVILVFILLWLGCSCNKENREIPKPEKDMTLDVTFVSVGGNTVTLRAERDD